MRSARWVLAAALAALAAAPAAAQDFGQINQLAQLLRLEDRRAFDLAALQGAA